MQYLKTHYGRAYPITFSDDINMPNPANAGLTSLTTDSESYLLIDSSVTFTTNLIGNTVLSGGSIATVTGFVDDHTLTLSNDIIPSDGIPYTLYVPTPNEGFSIYIPSGQTAGSNIRLLTVGGDIVTFSSVGDANSSMILPVQALRVFEIETTVANIIALW